MNFGKIIYWLSTILMCGIFTFSAQMYFRNTDMVQGLFEGFGYPRYIVIPLAILKVLGIIAVLVKKPKFLMEWAYAGFFFDAVLAFVAHQKAGDGQSLFSILAIIFIVVSRISYWSEFERDIKT